MLSRPPVGEGPEDPGTRSVSTKNALDEQRGRGLSVRSGDSYEIEPGSRVIVEIGRYCGKRRTRVPDPDKARWKAGWNLGLGNNRNGAARYSVGNEIMPIYTISGNADKQAAFLRMPAVIAHTGHLSIQASACADNFQTVYEFFDRLHLVRNHNPLRKGNFYPTLHFYKEGFHTDRPPLPGGRLQSSRPGRPSKPMARLINSRFTLINSERVLFRRFAAGCLRGRLNFFGITRNGP